MVRSHYSVTALKSTNAEIGLVVCVDDAQGGWLVAEEPDNDVAESADVAHPLAQLFDTCYHKRVEFASAATITDLRFGKVLPRYIVACGLTEIANEGVARAFHGGDPFSRMWIKTWQRIDDAVIASGILSEWEVGEIGRAVSDR